MTQHKAVIKGKTPLYMIRIHGLAFFPFSCQYEIHESGFGQEYRFSYRLLRAVHLCCIAAEQWMRGAAACPNAQRGWNPCGSSGIKCIRQGR
jgi:hypothetical protein